MLHPYSTTLHRANRLGSRCASQSVFNEEYMYGAREFSSWKQVRTWKYLICRYYDLLIPMGINLKSWFNDECHGCLESLFGVTSFSVLRSWITIVVVWRVIAASIRTISSVLVVKRGFFLDMRESMICFVESLVSTVFRLCFMMILYDWYQRRYPREAIINSQKNACVKYTLNHYHILFHRHLIYEIVIHIWIC